ncbi:MAG TPA: EAL domain-containing protein [Geminocystis sp. M7585_C2015_104]|nr:EAL domain-containing protein [Geminocystis sp. M7585_C2015_104]
MSSPHLPPSGENRLHPYLIYIIDDDRTNLEILSLFLKKNGFRVIAETEIIKGIQEIFEVIPDLIILDIVMPELNGFRACSILKKSPKTKDIPIIFLTALGDTEDKVRGLELGAYDYITKPVQYPELLSRINSCLKISQLTKKLKAQNKRLLAEVKARKEAEIHLKETEERLKTIINNSLQGMVVVDLEGKIIFINQQAEKLFNRPRHRLLGHTLGIPAELNTISELEIPRKEEIITVEMRAVPIIWNGKGAYLISLIDITERKKMEQELKILYQASEQSPASIVITDAQGNIQYVNAKFEAISGYKREEVIGKNPRILKSGYTSPEEYKKLWQTITSGKEWRGEFHNKRKNGELYWERALISPIFNSAGVITNYVAVKEDITEQKKQEILLKYQAIYDNLTKIPNRNYALQKVEDILENAKETKTNVGLMFIDLDHFKEVNDTFGHDYGDELLIQATERMKKILRSTDLLARIGGDEFLLAVPMVISPLQLQIIAEKIISVLSEPFEILKKKVNISASIGIAIFPQDGEDLKQLIRRADLAMYQAKRSGRRQFQFYHDELEETDNGASSWERSFFEGIQNNQFKFFYQPVIDLSTEKVVSAEILVRWQHPRFGLIYPEEFISTLEKSGLIYIFEEYLINTLVGDLKSWPILRTIPISINISEYQLKNQETLNTIHNCIRKNQINPGKLQFEIKEQSIQKNPHASSIIIRGLNQLGIDLCLDDFGQGAFCISNLHKFPFKSVKIAQNYVERIETEKETRLFIEAIIAACKVLNIKTIAKGIETERQKEILQRINCNYGQGYLFSYPLTAADFATYLARESKE